MRTAEARIVEYPERVLLLEADRPSQTGHTFSREALEDFCKKPGHEHLLYEDGKVYFLNPR